MASIQFLRAIGVARGFQRYACILKANLWSRALVRLHYFGKKAACAVVRKSQFYFVPCRAGIVHGPDISCSPGPNVRLNW
jgi:hypothetical protein